MRRAGLGALVLVGAGALSCQAPPRPALVVAVSGVPAGARSLAGTLLIDGKPAGGEQRFGLEGALGQGEVRLGVAIPAWAGAAGELRLGLRALDESGCLIGAGEARGALVDRAEIALPLRPIVKARCRREPLVLLGVSPAQVPAAGPQRITVSGVGFLPGATVKVAGLAATAVEVRSALELEATLPPLRRLGAVPVQVQDPDGLADTTDGLLRATAESLRFTAKVVDAPRTPFSLAVGDLNRDGADDIAVSGYFPSVLSVFLSDGRLRSLRRADKTGLPSTGGYVLLAETAEKGKLDILLRAAPALKLFANRGDGAFPEAGVQDIPDPDKRLAMGHTHAFVATDARRSGAVDLLVPFYNHGAINSYVNLGNGGFVQGRGYSTASDLANSQPDGVDAADLDQDGWPDLVVRASEQKKIHVLLNLKDGTFSPSVFDYPVPFSYLFGDVNSLVRCVALGDLDGDGWPDLAVVDGTDRLHLRFNQRRSMMTDKWLGFSEETVYPVGSRPLCVALADLNGDGRSDLVVPAYGDNKLTILLNQGGGAFPQAADPGRLTLDVGTRPGYAAVGDIDGDGRPDVVVANEGSDNLTVLYSEVE